MTVSRYDVDWRRASQGGDVQVGEFAVEPLPTSVFAPHIQIYGD